jgi:hypothetical protein
MTMPSFPAYMPAPMISGFSQSPDPNMLTTQVTPGIVEDAPRNPTPVIPRVLQYGITSLANRNAFEAWVNTTLIGGSLFFTWPDPLSGTSKIARIVGGKVSFTLDSSGGIWIAALTIETYG